MTDQTSQPLTEEQLDEIEARAAAATAGPWGVYTFGGDSLIEIAAGLEDTGCGYRARRTIARFEDEPLDNDPTHSEWTADEDWAQVQADAEFTAHARGDVDALLAEVRRLHNNPPMQCIRCDTAVGWVDAPTGGWWAHETHPADDHDADPRPAAEGVQR